MLSTVKTLFNGGTSSALRKAGPALLEPSDQAATADGGEEAGMTGLRRIAYADDDPDLRLVARIALGKLGGYELLLCESGEELLEKAPEFQPDLILLDVMMPGLNGPETFQALHGLEATASVPVAFVTASVGEDELGRLRKLGSIGAVHKPFEAGELLDEVQNLWRRRSA